jgi:hypothetical protein
VQKISKNTIKKCLFFKIAKVRVGGRGEQVSLLQHRNQNQRQRERKGFDIILYPSVFFLISWCTNFIKKWKFLRFQKVMYFIVLFLSHFTVQMVTKGTFLRWFDFSLAFFSFSKSHTLHSKGKSSRTSLCIRQN